MPDPSPDARLIRTNATWNDAFNELYGWLVTAHAERDAARAEVKRLRSILALAAELAVEGGSAGLRELAEL